MSGSGEGLRVLVVDANRLFRAVSSKWLETHEAVGEVNIAVSGSDALAALDDAPCDLVLADAALPDMDGFELTRRIKSRPMAPLVVILVLFDYGAVRREAGRAGADACFDKSAFTRTLDPLLVGINKASPRRGRHESPD